MIGTSAATVHCAGPSRRCGGAVSIRQSTNTPSFVRHDSPSTSQPRGGIQTLVAVSAVVALTFAFRWPSCGESFWLDELHSAWTVHGSMSDVAWRAGQGNQTTLYFRGLWLWSRVFGSGEAAMRASSVLASCLAAGLLVAGVRHRSGRLIGGVVAGAAFAIDPQAVFFGCELRPYAWLFPCAVVAVWAMTCWLRGPAGRDGRSRAVMVAAIGLAALLHPTSLGVLGSLLLFAGLAAIWLGRWHWGRADRLSCFILLATAAALYWSSLPESWQHRDLWRSFGQARRWESMWLVWDYTALLLVPGVVTIGLLALDWWTTGGASGRQWNRSDEEGLGIGVLAGWVAVFATCGFFVASYFQWVPLWHRRYFITALPLLCWTTGELVAAGERAIHRIGRRKLPTGFAESRVVRPAAAILVATVLGYQAWDQGTLAVLASGRWPVQLRGEDWRDVVATVRGRIEGGDRVWLDSGLIEANVFAFPPPATNELSPRQRDYLGYPLAGPYHLPGVTVVACGEHDDWLTRHVQSLPSQPVRVWLISRSRPTTVDRFINRLATRRGVVAERLGSRIPGVYRLDFEAVGSKR